MLVRNPKRSQNLCKSIYDGYYVKSVCNILELNESPLSQIDG